MKTAICVGALAVCLSAAVPAMAQEKLKPSITSDALAESMPSFASHPEMWLYLQEQKRYDDPRAAVRRNAEFQADQRKSRIAATKWFGYSNSRPVTSPTPIMGSYSPAWTGNSNIPGQWVGAGSSSTVAIDVDASNVRR